MKFLKLFLFLKFLLTGVSLSIQGMEKDEPLFANSAMATAQQMRSQRTNISSYMQLLPKELYKEVMDKQVASAKAFWLFKEQELRNINPNLLTIHKCEPAINRIDIKDNIAAISIAFTASFIGTVIIVIIDLENKKFINCFSRDQKGFYPDIFLDLPKNRIITVTSKERKIWDLQTGDCLQIIPVSEELPLEFWNEDLCTLDHSENEFKLTTFTQKEGICKHTFKGAFQNLCFRRYEKSLGLIVAKTDGVIEIWDLKTNRCIKVLKAESKALSSFYNNVNHRLITGHDDRVIRIWDLHSGKLIKSFSMEPTAVVDNPYFPLIIQFIDKYNWLLAACLIGNTMESFINIWDVESGLSLKSLTFPGLSQKIKMIKNDTELIVILKNNKKMIALSLPLIDASLKTKIMEGKDCGRDLLLQKAYECYLKNEVLDLKKNNDFAQAFSNLPGNLQSTIEKLVSVKKEYKHNKPLKLFEHESLLKTYNEMPEELEEIKQTIKKAVTPQTEPPFAQTINNNSNWFALLQTAADVFLSLK